MKNYVATLKKIVNTHRRQLLFSAAINTVSATLLILALLLIILQVLFLFIPFSIIPYIFDLAIVAGSLFLVIKLLLNTVFRAPDHIATARILEEQMPEQKRPSISLALEIAQQPAAETKDLVSETLRRAVEQSRQYPRRIKNLYKPVVLISALIAVGTVVILDQKATPRLSAFWTVPLTAFQPVEVVLTPRSRAVKKNASVTLTFRVKNAAYPQCRLITQNLGETQKNHLSLRARGKGEYRHTIDSLNQSLVYTVRYGGKTFGPETLTVVPPPTLHSLDIRLHPPTYTGLPPRDLPRGQGNFSAFTGTRVTYALRSSFSLKKANLIVDKTDTIALSVSAKEAHGDMALMKSADYSFSFIDSLGQQNDSLPSFYMSAITDEKPLVTLIRPGENKLLEAHQKETLWVEAVDDVGMNYLGLRWFTSADMEDTTFRRQIPIQKNKKTVRSQITWDLVPLGLYPGDTVYYWMLAKDNNPLRGKGWAVSDTFWFRLPGFGERHKMLAEKNDFLEESLEGVRAKQEKLQETLSQIKMPESGQAEMSWEEKKVIEQAREEFQAQQDSLEKALEVLKEVVEEMTDEGMANDEILQKMDEVRKAIEELVEEYGDSLFVNPEDMEQGITQEDMQEALEKMAELLPNLEQSLDNTLKYLEMLKKDQKLEHFARQFEELGENQQSIADSGAGQEMKKRQEMNTTEARDLMERLKNEKIPGSEKPLVSPADVPALEKLDSLVSQMQRQMRSGSMPSQAMKNNMTAESFSTAAQLRAMMSSAMMARMQKERTMMLEMVNDILTLSQWQREYDEEKRRQNDMAAIAQRQQALADAVRNSRGMLDSLRMVPPQLLQDAMEGYDGALSAMMDELSSLSTISRGRQNSNHAVSYLNSAAQALLDANKGMMNGPQASGGSGGQGMMGMMRKLSGKQAAINAATAQILEQMLGGKKPGEGEGKGQGKQGDSQGIPGGAKAREAARKAQQALADQIDALTKEYADGSGEGLGRKRLEELEKEARRLAKMLENPTAELRERQDRFLARMLQTTLSIHKEGEGKEKRQSESAKTMFSSGSFSDPREGYSDADSFYRLRMQALQGNIPDEYYPAVKSYFDSLGVLFLNKN